MPNEQSHLDLAKRNETFLQSINSSTFPDWVVTVAFYAALHYIDAFLARRGRIEVKGHGTREDSIKLYPELFSTAIWYFQLKSASVRARYYGDQLLPGEMSKHTDQHLVNIRKTITRILSPPATQ